MEIFFVLSGFLVGGMFYEKFQDNQKTQSWILGFWVRRWMRTLPNYYLFLLIAATLSLWKTGSVPDLRLYSILKQNLWWQIPAFYIESWSLTIEELFYLALPIVVWAVTLKRGSPNVQFLFACASIFIASLVFRALAPAEATFNIDIRMIAAFRLDSLMIGAMAYVLFRHTMCTGPVVALGGFFFSQ